MTAAGVSPAVAAPVIPPDMSGALVMNDSFDSENTSIWEKATWQGSPDLGGTWWEENHVRTADGTLEINLDNQPGPNRTGLASGEYRTKKKHSFGKYSVRKKPSAAANGSLMGGSMFTYTNVSEGGTAHDEIDIEFFGKTQLHTNYFASGKPHVKPVDLGFDATADFHTYDFVWTDQNIKWFVDGTCVRRVDASEGLPRQSGKIMLNMWANGYTYSPQTPVVAEYDSVSYVPGSKLRVDNDPSLTAACPAT